MYVVNSYFRVCFLLQFAFSSEPFILFSCFFLIIPKRKNYEQNYFPFRNSISNNPKVVWFGAVAGALASAVSNAGGLACLGRFMHPETLREHIRKCHAATHNPFGVNIPLMVSAD